MSKAYFILPNGEAVTELFVGRDGEKPQMVSAEAAVGQADTPPKAIKSIKPECLECPCFGVRGCDECDERESFSLGECHGIYPSQCTPEDCVNARFDLLHLQIDEALRAIILEYKSASEVYAPMNSPHEGYAIIKEELEELWDEIRRREPDVTKLRKEATQVAAMALRFILDLVAPDVTEDINAELATKAGEETEDKSSPETVDEVEP